MLGSVKALRHLASKQSLSCCGMASHWIHEGFKMQSDPLALQSVPEQGDRCKFGKSRYGET